MMAEKAISVILSERLNIELMQNVALSNKKISDIVRDALEFYFKHNGCLVLNLSKVTGHPELVKYLQAAGEKHFRVAKGQALAYIIEGIEREIEKD